MYIAFEGIDNVGKSTAIKAVCNALSDLGIPNLGLREPSGIMRGLIKGESDEWDSSYATYKVPPFERLSIIYAHVIAHMEQDAKFIIPALDDGKIVLTDRNAYTSMIPYQVGGNGFGRQMILDILKPVRYPDAVLWFDANAEELSALGRNPKSDDQFDTADDEFRERVYLEYQQAYRSDRKGIWHRIDARKPFGDVVTDCIITIKGILEDRASLDDGSEQGYLNDYERYYDARKVQA